MVAVADMLSILASVAELALSLWSALTGWKQKQAGRQEQAADDNAATLRTVEAERNASVKGKAESTQEALRDGTF
jgi:hypothetical protein